MLLVNSRCLQVKEQVQVPEAAFRCKYKVVTDIGSILSVVNTRRLQVQEQEQVEEAPFQLNKQGRAATGTRVGASARSRCKYKRHRFSCTPDLLKVNSFAQAEFSD